MGLLLAASRSSPRPCSSPCGAEHLGKQPPPWTVRSAGAVGANGSSGGPRPGLGAVIDHRSGARSLGRSSLFPKNEIVSAGRNRLVF